MRSFKTIQDYLNRNGEKQIKDFIQNLGGWSLFNTYGRNGPIRKQMKLSSLEKMVILNDYSVDPFFSVGVVINPNDPSKYVINVSHLSHI